MLLKPELASHLGSFIAIAILLFSPNNFPAERLPGALQAVHSALPVEYMADVVRWSLTGVSDKAIGLAFAVVAAWCAAGLAASCVSPLAGSNRRFGQERELTQVIW